MKKSTVILILLLVPFLCKSQRISVKVDEFTKAVIRESSWQTLYSFSKTCKVRIREINGELYFEIKYMDTKSIAVPEGEAVMFLLENDVVVKLLNTNLQLGCIGCGATGFIGSEAIGIHLKLKTTKEELKPILESPIKKMRIYTTDGYIQDKIKSSTSEDIQKLVKMFLQER